jgi:hypothetical protein
MTVIQGTRTSPSTVQTQTAPNNGIYRVAAIAAAVQIVCLILTFTILTIIGPEPTTAEELFTMFQEDRLRAILRLDLYSLVNVALFTITAFAVYAAIRHMQGLNAALATALVYMGVALGVSSHSGLSFIRLGEWYMAASAERQAQMLAAGDALLAVHWWNSTAGFFAGVFLQGGTAVLFLLALPTKQFSRITAYSAILANGLDFVHLFIMLISPQIAGLVLAVGGIFYVIWYPALTVDFVRLSRARVT